MSIMDQFRAVFQGTPNVVQPGNPNQAVVQQNLAPPGSTQLQAPVVVDPANPQPNPTNPQEPESPLKAFEGLWKTDPKAPNTEPVSLAEFAFNVKPEDVVKNVNQIDFTRSLSPELLEKIGKGDMAAVLQAINEVGRQSMVNSLLVGSKTVEAGIRTSGTHLEKSLPSYVRKETISQSLREDNPLFSHPATAPMLAGLESQLTRQFPNATAAEITEHAKKYLVGFAEMVTGVKQDPKNPNGNQPNNSKTIPATDFSTWEV